MRLRPRHYVLFLIIVAVFLYNIVRHRHDERNAISSTPAPVVITGPRSNTPAWAAFDHAASLRDAPDSEFQPALADLHQLMPLDPNQNDGHLTDIKGCLTWLEFYRQGMAQTRTDPQMKDRSIHHLDGCTKYHLDTTA
jgi:hypothetical protein